MGDRRMAEIKTTDGSLYLYVHWEGYRLPKLARDAVKVASPRLGDEPYWVRIVIDQITKGGRDEQTGYGLMLKPNSEDEYNNNRPSVIIDALTGSVTVIGSDNDD